MGEVHLVRLEPLRRGLDEVAHPVPDRDAGDPRLPYGAADLGGRYEREQRVRGSVVADRDAEVEQVVDGDARGVAEPAEPGRARGRDPFRSEVDHRGAVEVAAVNAVEYGDGEGHLHQGREGELDVRIDADL